MGDTYQVVQWALEYTCPMRYGENWVESEVAYEQLVNIKRYSRALAQGTILGDICVCEWDTSDTGVRLPEYGLIISHTFDRYGGVAVVEESCQNCTVNLNVSSRAGPLAGCSSSFYCPPWDEQLAQSLEKIILKNGLEAELKNVFVSTNPIWFGLWIKSSLTQEQCEILSIILSDLPLKKEQFGIQHFLSALKVYIEQGIRVHVSLVPPGHSDMGWYTVFDHCPQCKASPWMLQMEQALPSEAITCKVCGYCYIPSLTFSSKREGINDIFGDSLEEILGIEKYRTFARDYLSDKGVSSKQIEQVLEHKKYLKQLYRNGLDLVFINELENLVVQGKIINAVIKYQKRMNCSLKEARKYIESLK
ncbi:MAG: hypothetical protein GY832_18425 [Chloroflexi bacterium]|nr:hypothetical protein [Chloroflexota bacterium]